MKGSVTRNDTIARVCHDTKLAETKGSGIDRMWRKMVEAGLSRPTMESDRTAATFTIRLLLCHFFDEDTLDWLKRFAAYDLNDNQRTALVFLREVGAIDAVAYRQLTGCKPKLVAKELAGIKDQGLMIQKGRTRGTYYVPAGRLEESIEDEKRKLISQAISETTTPQAVLSTAQGVMMTPLAAMSTAQDGNAPVREESAPAQGENAPVKGLTSQAGTLTSQAQALTSQAQELISQPQPEGMPISLIKRIKTLPRRARNEEDLLSIIVDVCSWKAQTNESLAQILHRSPEYIRKFIAKHIGKELDYLYPMMPHHPRQAYVALDRHQKEDVS